MNVNSKSNPSLAHLCVVVHLFGAVRYVFEMSQSERATFCGALFEEPERQHGEDEQTQTQESRSAMFTVWNLIADLVETQDQKPNEQQQIVDFYVKSGSTFPRLACLMQLYFNAMNILEEVKNDIVFSEGDGQDTVINEDFVNNVRNKIHSDYYVYDSTYLPRNENNQVVINPMVIVGKDAVIAAWKWYEHHLKIASTLFTIDYEFTGRYMAPAATISCRPKTLKQMIMLFDFNIFPISALTAKHPVTGQTGICKNRPALGERALQELINDSLLKFNYFLIDVRGRNVKSYMKMPLPPINDPSREQFINMLMKHEINADEYLSNYEKASIPPNNNFSKLTIDIFEKTSAFIGEYGKYKGQLNHVIEKLLGTGDIAEREHGFIILNPQIFDRAVYDIQNLGIGERVENPSVIPKPRTTIEAEGICERTSERNAITTYNPTITEINQPDVILNDKLIDHADDLSRNIQNCSISTVSIKSSVNQSALDNIGENSGDLSTQDDIPEGTNPDASATETVVRKAMKALMLGRSVIYTKTDLTQICKRPDARLEAIKRLVEADLLQHGNNFWIEPNRTKKASNKVPKRLLREGWLKKGPDNPTDAAKFQFIRRLQETVNITYDDYLKSFYPNQTENVFTNNNWTLSDELIELFSSNFFYIQHVRWNQERFQSLKIQTGVADVINQEESALAKSSENGSDETENTNNLQEIMRERLVIDKDKQDKACVGSVSTRSKRKAELDERPEEKQELQKSRKTKKN